MIGRRDKCRASDTAARRGQVQLERNRFIAGRGVENNQHCHCPPGICSNAGSTFDDESVVGESPEVVETDEIAQHLGAQVRCEVTVVLREHSPRRCVGNRTDEAQAESLHWQQR